MEDWPTAVLESAAASGQEVRLAPVDSDGRDYRYVRVCPDADGRYRITG